MIYFIFAQTQNKKQTKIVKETYIDQPNYAWLNSLFFSKFWKESINFLGRIFSQISRKISSAIEN
jgi:hypothetical protein